MSFRTNDEQQLSLFDSTSNLTDREHKMLENSWCVQFAVLIFDNIDETIFEPLYSSNPASRPNTPVNVLVGANFLKMSFHCSDDEVIENLMFDIRWQVALRTTSFNEQPLSDKSLQRFRNRLIAYEQETGRDLMRECILALGDKLAKIMGIIGDCKRMDSMMIASNIRKLNRLELIYTCVADLAVYLHSHDVKLKDSLMHYCADNDRNAFIYHNKSDEENSKINTVLSDAKWLLENTPDSYQECECYLLLLRVISEQTKINDEGDYVLLTKEDGGMSSDILQSPYDPDATYREKAGKEHRGYVANLTEDVSVDEDGKVQHSLITDYQYAQNNKSDPDFLKDKLVSMGKQDKETAVSLDGAFPNDENEKLAAKNNITLIPTNLSGKPTDVINAEFEIEENTGIVKCPAGHTPDKTSYTEKNETYTATFDRSVCEGCPYFDRCHPTMHGRKATKRLSKKMIRRANQFKFRQTEEFKKYSRIRNGAETVPSLMRRRFNVDRFPWRGYLRTKLAFGFCVAAANFRKILWQGVRVDCTLCA